MKPSPSTPPQESGPQEPPHSLGGIVRRMGPGMIVAGSIVGSGELIATTSVGAETGFVLLWLILLGCAIKVFVQIELGRYTVTWGQTPLDALNQVPGPRGYFPVSGRGSPSERIGANWIVWAWAAMTLLILTQQGGIVGGVGQALAIQFPLTHEGRWHNDKQNQLMAAKVQLAMAKQDISPEGKEANAVEELTDSIQQLTAEIAEANQKQQGRLPPDAHLWATATAIVTSVLMLFGRYGLIQAVSTIFVGSFTLLTVLTLCMLQRQAAWAVTGRELWSGLSVQLPATSGSNNSIHAALATFGLIGVGAGELLMYPYWCLEKGYAQFAGERTPDSAWATRARGWMRVMQWDAWGSMLVYTFATATFYLLGAAVLWRVGLKPEGSEMIRTLSQMYAPVFGDWASGVFLLGAFAVLYSTFFVVTASFARMIADGLGVMNVIPRDAATRDLAIRVIGVLWPLLAVTLLWYFSAPKAMVLASGVAQALMLPILGFAAIYFRYRRIDPRLRPAKLWDLGLWISVLGFFVFGAWTIASRLSWG